MSGPRKRTTTTTLVLEELVRADDLLTVRDLMDRLPSEGVNRITAALHHLHIHCAVQCIEGGSRLWWFATPQDDNRYRVLREVREGIVHKKPRKRKQQT